MIATYEFTAEEIEAAFDYACSACECCGKALTWSNSRSRGGGRGQWEAPHGSRFKPEIFCCGGGENCHLNCGHYGHYGNPAITPRSHTARQPHPPELRGCLIQFPT